MADIQKNSREVLRVSRDTFKNQTVINARVWVRSREAGTLVPTRKGIAIRPELVQPLIEALESVKSLQTEPDTT